jgi:protoheme IX farnesyltransferase
MEQPLPLQLAASLDPWAKLIKISLCLPVAGSAAFGSILHSPVLTPSLALVVGGVFLLACGAAAGNSLQEQGTDSLFIRTRNRPLVTGRLGGRQAIRISSLLVILGLTALFFSGSGQLPLLLSIAALLLYNGVYTPMKQTSVFALFPGALAGALPPLIGWTAAGGLLDDPNAWLLFFLFFLWQIPHFCLILLYHQADYCAVERPALIRLLPEQSLKRITLVWILALAVVALALALNRALLQPGSRLVLAIMAGILMTFCVPLWFRRQSPGYRLLFIVLNGSFFTALLLVAVLQLLTAR